MSDIGEIVYDRDAVYIDIGGGDRAKSATTGEGAESDGSADEQLIGALKQAPMTLDASMRDSKLQLFANSTPIAADGDPGDGSLSDAAVREDDADETAVAGGRAPASSADGQPSRVRRPAFFGESEDAQPGDQEELGTDDDSGSDGGDDRSDGSPIATPRDDGTDHDGHSSDAASVATVRCRRASGGAVRGAANSETRKPARVPALRCIRHTHHDHGLPPHPPCHVMRGACTVQPAIPHVASGLDFILGDAIVVIQNDQGEETPVADSAAMLATRATSLTDDQNIPRWKERLAERARTSYVRYAHRSVAQLVYGDETVSRETAGLATDSHADDDPDDAAHVSGGGLFRRRQRAPAGLDDVDTARFDPPADELAQWADASSANTDAAERLRNLFVTGEWSEHEDAATLLRRDDAATLAETAEASAADDSDVAYGDFEDLETGQVVRAAASDRTGDAEEPDATQQHEEQRDRRRIMEKKRLKKAQFDAHYDAGMATAARDADADVDAETTTDALAIASSTLRADVATSGDADNPMKSLIEQDSAYYLETKKVLEEQAERNRAAFAHDDPAQRIKYEGISPGSYVRIELANMPCEFVHNFDPSRLLLLGGLLPNEGTMGFVQVRLKKHRWYRKILKSNDPLVFSIGWRRTQSLPVYAIEDHNGRIRMLKYTPQHMHCLALLYAPLVPQNTGVLAVQSLGTETAGFRIAATGTAIEMDQSFRIVKKLKLVGTPYKIFHHTAFVKGMFASMLEAAKYEGAAIRTVSGVRGQIKRAVRTPPGAFRASFEDKILISGALCAAVPSMQLLSWRRLRRRRYRWPCHRGRAAVSLTLIRCAGRTLATAPRRASLSPRHGCG